MKKQLTLTISILIVITFAATPTFAQTPDWGPITVHVTTVLNDREQKGNGKATGSFNWKQRIENLRFSSTGNILAIVSITNRPLQS